MKTKHSLILIILLLMARSSYSQQVHIIGKLTQENISKIKALVSTMSASISAGKISIFLPGERKPFVYKRGKLNSASWLDIRLGAAAQTPASGLLTESTITRVKNQIAEKSNNVLVVYNSAEQYTSDYSYNNFDRLLNFASDPVNRDMKFTFLLIFKKEKPAVKIMSPKTGESFRSKITGVSFGPVRVTNVQVRINNGTWEPASGTTDWKYAASSEEVHLVEARAIDELYDTSVVAVSSDVRIIPVSNPALTYLYPDKLKNVTPKCNNNDGMDFDFKIALDPSVSPGQVSMVIENAKKQKLYETLLSDLPSSSIQVRPKNGKDEYCIFLVYSVLGAKNACAFDDTENYYYYYKYHGTDPKVVMPAKILIHFSSFDAGFRYEYCECD